MIALDTNILARYLLADDEAQAERATQLIEQHTCFIPVTVGLELAWVLRSQRIAKNDVIAAFAALLNIDNLNWQFKPAWHLALLWAGAGMDIADAIHLALSRDCQQFYSFDQRLIQCATRDGLLPECVQG